jgi:beta-phosphoglucomutase-like phosphatase (HAD superfamily)
VATTSGAAPGAEHAPPAREGRPKAVIWDLDGTLSDDKARAHFVEVERGRARDWKSYFDAIDTDPPIAASMEVLRALHAAGLRILFLTGRPDYTRAKTVRWLEANGLTEYDALIMRPDGEQRPAGYFKAEAVERLRREYELVCAFEDRIDVADHLREAGVPVFLYGAGMEAAAEALEALDVDQDELLADGDADAAGRRRRDQPDGMEEDGGEGG